MGQIYDSISKQHRTFIENQKLFFVGTAGVDGRVNVSPKGMDTLRVIDDNNILWLNLTGSGNETAAHVRECNRITIMFCAFENEPKILRLYGKANIIHPRDDNWNQLIKLFPPYEGARQIIDMRIDSVGTSCGFGVPLYEFQGQRDELRQWAGKKGRDGISEYWEKKNQFSIDGKPTDIFNKF